MESVILDRLTVKKNIVDYCFTASEKIKKYFKHNKMFVEYDVDISDIPVSILVIPFVANILPLMWLTNSILWVTDIDRTFYDAIPKIKYAYQEFYPHYKLQGTIVPAYTTDNTYFPEREAVLLFSGGVDSNATFIRIMDKKPILVNVQGWFHSEITDNRVYRADKEDITKIANMHKVTTNFIRSNFANVIDHKSFSRNIAKKLKNTYWLGFQHSLAFISITSILAYKLKIRNIYIASSHTIGYRRACASDPTTDIQFKFATEGRTIHDGFELNRQDKVNIIVNYQKSLNSDFPLRVCSFNFKNCCACEKCFRTIASIVAEGGDIKRFSFTLEDDLKSHFQKLMSKLIFDCTVRTAEVYRLQIKKRMIGNMSNISNREFTDWFVNYDFKRNRKIAILKYRVYNFLPILKRKIINIFH